MYSLFVTEGKHAVGNEIDDIAQQSQLFVLGFGHVVFFARQFIAARRYELENRNDTQSAWVVRNCSFSFQFQQACSVHVSYPFHLHLS